MSFNRRVTNAMEAEIILVSLLVATTVGSEDHGQEAGKGKAESLVDRISSETVAKYAMFRFYRSRN